MTTKIRVLCIKRLGTGGKKDVEMLSKLPDIDEVIHAYYNYSVGSAEDNHKLIKSMPKSYREFCQQNSIDLYNFAPKNLEQLAEQYLFAIDAVFIPGAAFDPSPEHCLNQPLKKAPDPRREKFELEIIKKARERGIPLLTVCAGSWRLANAFGGKTFTLSDQALKEHNQPKKLREFTHDAILKPGSLLHGIHTSTQKNNPTQTDTMKVNSTHWRVTQAPERQAKTNTRFFQQFETTAIDPKTKTVEAFESKYGSPALGIQYHPEVAVESSADYPTHYGVLKAWVQAGQTYRNKQAINRDIKNMESETPKLYAKL